MWLTPAPRLHRGWAQPCHIRAGIQLRPATPHTRAPCGRLTSHRRRCASRAHQRMEALSHAPSQGSPCTAHALEVRAANELPVRRGYGCRQRPVRAAGLFARVSAPSPIGGSPCGHAARTARVSTYQGTLPLINSVRHRAASRYTATTYRYRKCEHRIYCRSDGRPSRTLARNVFRASRGRGYYLSRANGVCRVVSRGFCGACAGSVGVKPRIQPHSCTPAAGEPS